VILVKRYTGKSVAVLAWGGGEGGCFWGAFPGCGSWGRAGLRWGCAPRVFVHCGCGPCAWGHFDTGMVAVGGREGCDMGVQRWSAWERGRCLAGACGVHFGAPGVFSAAYWRVGAGLCGKKNGMATRGREGTERRGTRVRLWGGDGCFFGGGVLACGCTWFCMGGGFVRGTLRRVEWYRWEAGAVTGRWCKGGRKVAWGHFGGGDVDVVGHISCLRGAGAMFCGGQVCARLPPSFWHRRRAGGMRGTGVGGLGVAVVGVLWHVFRLCQPPAIFWGCAAWSIMSGM
jgi:hypothetical protein